MREKYLLSICIRTTGAYERWKPDTKTVKGETFETIIITRAKDRNEDVQERKKYLWKGKVFFSDWGFLQEKCNFVYIVMKITPKNLEKHDLSSVALENVLWGQRKMYGSGNNVASLPFTYFF